MGADSSWITEFPYAVVKALKETQSNDPQPVAWPQPFFIQHRTPDWNDVASFYASCPSTLPVTVYHECDTNAAFH